NDTAAFAESIAKARGRNQAWAAKAVRHSESIIADIALREGIIDMVVDSRENLLQRLPGFKLRAAKNDLKSLVQGITASKEIPMSIKNRLISFFADPNLAYMIMSLGGLCLWVEISHPGLIFPGVLGAICIVLSLISFQMMPIHYGALAFILLGMGMIIAELFLPAFGVLGIGGLVSFILGSIFLMDTGIPDFQLSLGLILSIATTLAAAAFVLGTLVWRARRTQVRSGVETLVGQFAEVREAISETGGKVFIQGELWSASSSSGEAIPTGRKVKVIALKSLALVVAPV
ncbi:MAG: nodulation protein NfeD, partial [Deltaproteobacteria bacterium]|nr:nodulation protein NfeD [Deltaproteobacteria bacterium]